jgi:membrane protein
LEGVEPGPPRTVPSQRKDVLPGPEAAKFSESDAPDPLGRTASAPRHIPWRGWKRVLHRTFQELISDRIPLVAAGCAFYATLALFPAISMLVSVYGLAFDPRTVEPQLQTLHALLPPAAFELISQRVHTLVTQGSGKLGIGLVVSTAITLWSAATATKSILGALNIAYEERETRSVLVYQLTAFGMTLGAIIGAVLGLVLLVGLPTVMNFAGISWHQKQVIQGLGMLGLLVFLMLSLSLLYRFGPCREPARWHWVTPGSVLATILWLVASYAFSFYVGHYAGYDAFYGPLATVVGVMMWFYVTVFVVLMGAELNAELELQTARDTTDGQPAPIGRRGAYVADHVAGR